MIFHPREKTLSQYLDKDLSDQRQARITKHLDKCPSCRQKIRELEQMGAALVMEKGAPTNIRERFMSLLGDQKRTKTPVCAEIKAVMGVVLVHHNNDGKEREAFPGMALRIGDTVKVVGNSLALLELTDGSVFYLNRETEFLFSDTRYPVILRLGEFFAMMKPQKNVFQIKTPSAVLGVIGTDFDTRVTKEDKTLLQVLEGRVSFENEAGRVVVKGKRQVEAARHTLPEMTQIIHSRLIGDWANQIKPANGKKGSTIGKIFLWILIIGIIAWAYLYWSNRPGADSTSGEKVKILDDKKDPLTLTSPYSIQGLSWKISSRSEVQTNEGWSNNFEMVNRIDVIERDEQRGSNICLTIEYVKEQGEMQEAAKMSIGKKYVYRLTPGGDLVDIRSYSGSPIENMELLYLIRAFGMCEMSSIFPNSSVLPGEEWTIPIDVKIPDFPSVFIKGQTSHVFAGYGKRSGREVAVIRTNSNISIGGITLEFTPNPKVKVVVGINNMTIDSQNAVIIDMESGRLVGYQGVEREYNKRMTQTQYIEGRNVPIRKNITEDKPTFMRSYSTIEYLD
jgi:ferric-dicitrate binding protein FerR (iron transport regulator)